MLPKFIRVTMYVSQTEYRELKAKLSLKGMTISEWFRSKIREFLDEE